MADPPGLSLLQSGVWKFRQRVPTALRAVIKRREFLRSFGKVSHADARLAAWRYQAEVADEIERAELQLGLRAKPVSSFGEARPGALIDVDEVARRYLAARLATSDPFPVGATEQEEFLNVLDEDAANMGSRDIASDPGLQLVARRFAERAGITLSDNPYLFFEAMAAAELEYLQRQSDRLRDRPTGAINPAFEGVEAVADSASISLALAIEMYGSREKRAGLAPSTHKMTSSRLGVLAEHLGPDRAVNSIKRSDLNAYVAFLKERPAHKRQRNGAEKSAFSEGGRFLSAKTIKIHVETAASLFKWLEAEHHIIRSPAVTIDTPPVPKNSTRRPFEPAEMVTLLNATSVEAQGRKNWAFWTVRIAALHGLRLTEPLGLLVSDVVEREGNWCFRVEGNHLRSVKTEETGRLVPIHPLLVEFGLPALITGRKSDELLFADTPRGNGRSFGAAQKRLARLIDRKVTADPTLVLHSLRHNFRDAQRVAEMPSDIAAALGGWKFAGGTSSSMEGYGKGYSLATLAQWIAKIGYAGTELSLMTKTN